MGNLTMLVLLCLLSVTVLPCHGATARLEPLSYIALLNQSHKATFTCTVHGANYASWEINDEPDLVHKQSERERRGIETEHERIAGTQRSYHATLKLSPIEINQYTEIKCWAAVRDGMGTSMVSETAIFQVQGVLGKPLNVTSIPVNLTHTEIEWLPPYTLNITDIEPDIQQYTVCVSFTDISRYCFNSTAPDAFILPNLNVHKEINISAWNNLGEGETARLSVDACEHQGIKGVEAATEVGKLAEITLYIRFKHNLSSKSPNKTEETICFCLYNLTLTLNNNFTYFGHLIPTIFQPESFSIPIPTSILPNEVYEAELACVTEENGITTLNTNTTLHFSSFDVQAVELELNEENLTLLICCEFVLGSQAQGCKIHITTNHTKQHHHNQQQQQQHYHNVTRNPHNGSTSCWEKDEIKPGITYTISVYDWEGDGSINLRKPVYFADVYVNTSHQEHNTEWTTSVLTTETTTKPKKEAPVTVHSTSLTVSQVAVDPKETSRSTHNLLFIIGGAGGSGALFLLLILVLLTVCYCVLVNKRKRSVVYSISAPREFINSGTSCNNNHGSYFELHSVDTGSPQTPSIEPLNSYYDSISKNANVTDLKQLYTLNSDASPITLSQDVTDQSNYQTFNASPKCHHFVQEGTTCSKVDNTLPVVQCPVYDSHDTKMPVYDQIVQPCPRFSQTNSSETFMINNVNYSSVADSVTLETNASYACPQDKRKFKVNRGPLPPLPLKTSSAATNGGRNAAAVYETVDNA